MKSFRQTRAAQLLGIALSAIAVAALIYKIDWEQTSQALKSVSAAWLVVAAFLVVGCYLLQSLRWRVLLALKQPPAFADLFRVIMIGYFGNAVLPLRAGDLLRAALLRRLLGGKAVQALSSVAIERLLDVLSILVLQATILPFVELPETLRAGLVAVVLVAGLSVLGLLVIAKLGEPAIRELRPWTHRLSPGLATRTDAWFAELVLSARNVLTLRRLPVLLCLSLLQWALVAIAMSSCIEAAGLTLPWSAGVLFTVVTNLGTAIPTAPASIGWFHALGVLALSPFGVPGGTAMAVAVVSHAVMTCLQLVGGLLAVWHHGGLATLRSPPSG